MNTIFLSHRWNGRLVGLLMKIAKKNGISFKTQEEATFMNLYLRVWEVAGEKEKEVIGKLMVKMSELKKVEDETQLVISKQEESDLFMKGTEDVALVSRDYEDYTKLLDETDFYAEELERLENEKLKNQKQNRIVWGCVVAVLLAIVVYNLPFFKEWRFYNEVVEARQTYKCHEYYDEYPTGRHYEDVMYLEVTISDKPIVVLREYLKKFPQGKYLDTMSEKYDELWDEEIAKYERRDKTKESPEAVRYMTAMLQHMKRHRINTVLLDVTSNVILKDYEEYDETIRKILELFQSDKSLSLKDNMVSLKKNFTQGDKSTLTKILSQGVTNGFNRMFSSDFVSVVTSKYAANENSPVLLFNYRVKNQCMGDDEDYPNIWTYSSNGIPKAYILGIDVKFDVHFSIPDSDITYTYSEIGEPGEEINGIQDVKDGYRQMTQVCFAKFSNKMSANLGLEETYFRGE